MIFLFLLPAMQIPDQQVLAVETCLCYFDAFILYGTEQFLLCLMKRVHFFVCSKEKKYKENPLLPFTLAPPHCVFKDIHQNGILIALQCRAVNDIQTMKKTFLCMEQKQQTRERNRWKSKIILGSLSQKCCSWLLSCPLGSPSAGISSCCPADDISVICSCDEL